MEVSGQRHPLCHFTPRNGAPVTRWIGGWMGPRAGLNAITKINIFCPCQESNRNSSVVQPVACPLRNLYLWDISVHLVRLARFEWLSYYGNWNVLQRHIVYKTMLYYGFSLHNSWCRYTIRFYIYYMFRPDVAIFRYIRSHNYLFLYLYYSPYTGQRSHIGSALYVRLLCDSPCCETY
jgi:hypothetical protein